MNHPLTDEIVCQIKSKDNTYFEDMRAAADWQLEQVIKYLEDNLLSILWSNYVPVDTHIDRFKKAMRPQQEEKTDNTVQDTELIQRAIRYWEDNS